MPAVIIERTNSANRYQPICAKCWRYCSALYLLEGIIRRYSAT